MSDNHFEEKDVCTERLAQKKQDLELMEIEIARLKTESMCTRIF